MPQTDEKDRILCSYLDSPIGKIVLCATEQGLCFLDFFDQTQRQKELAALERQFKAEIQAGENRHLIQVKKELKEYFAGERKAFTVALSTFGTIFQEKVWAVLNSIPYGHTISYQKQAEQLNNPKGVRAVASANGANRISIIIPCHRVIGKDGSLTGYGGGIERKRWLLEHEKRHHAGGAL